MDHAELPAVRRQFFYGSPLMETCKNTWKTFLHTSGGKSLACNFMP
jgi:hypothetical protein